MTSPGHDRTHERVVAVAEVLQNFWGDALPPGPAPWQRIVADALEVDDDLGEKAGLAVQSDELDLSVLEEVLSYVPRQASLQALLSPALRERIAQRRTSGDVGALAPAGRSRLMSRAIRTTGADCVGLYLSVEDCAVLADCLGMSTWERTGRARLLLPGNEALCLAMRQGAVGRGSIPVPTAATRWDDAPDLVPAPCVAVPFPSAGPGAPAAGALLLVWGPDGDPLPAEVATLVAPLAAEAEHLTLHGL